MSTITVKDGPHLKFGCPIFGAVLSRLIGVSASFAGGVT
jgi:hypothetical protein